MMSSPSKRKGGKKGIYLDADLCKYVRYDDVSTLDDFLESLDDEVDAY